MTRFTRQALATIVLLSTMTSLAHAQATRTWVSGVGDDANPCSRTAPCKTFAGAISKTATGGEISVLDPGGFGAVTITKSITINGEGTLAGILGAGTNGVIVNASPTSVVILRNLSINGGGTGLNGVRYLAGARLVVEDCNISGFTQNNIDVALTAGGNLVVRNTTMTGGADGLRMTGSGVVTGVAEGVRILGAVNGVHSLVGALHVTNSVISGNSDFGVFAEGGVIGIENSLLTNNEVAIQAQVGATVRMSNNDVYDNLTGFGCGGGTLASAGDNRKAGNVGGVVPACSPNAVINVQ